MEKSVGFFHIPRTTWKILSEFSITKKIVQQFSLEARGFARFS